jgi:hypothetical protein
MSVSKCERHKHQAEGTSLLQQFYYSKTAAACSIPNLNNKYIATGQQRLQMAVKRLQWLKLPKMGIE